MEDFKKTHLGKPSNTCKAAVVHRLAGVRRRVGMTCNGAHARSDAAAAKEEEDSKQSDESAMATVAAVSP